ncbi:MAG TPA: sporulation protein YqfD [Desulfotomaculum sp.]|nr:sporulation protein YqfD [Desulfotomaculum sp.]
MGRQALRRGENPSARPPGRGRRITSHRPAHGEPVHRAAKGGPPLCHLAGEAAEGALWRGAFFLAALYLFFSFVWVVEVTGAKKTPAAAILKAAAECGLKAGTPRWRINEKEVERSVLERFLAIAWVGVEIKGSRASVTVVEKKLPGRFPGSPAHIVARKAGLIKELLVLDGQPAVEEGDTVLPGQLLISGKIVPATDEERGGTGVAPGLPRYTRARGIVRARVWYEGYGEAPLKESGERRGRTVRTVVLKLGGREFTVYGPKRSPFARCKVRVTAKRPLQWRNFDAPVEFINKEYIELVRFEIKHTRAQARKIAEKEARRVLSSSLPEDCRLLREKVEEVRTARPESVVRVRIEAEVLEDIGVIQEFRP